MSDNSDEQNVQCKETQIFVVERHGPMYSIFHTITAVFALYLSFKCNRGFNLPDFLLACCCPVLYILYRFVVSPDFCEMTGLPKSL